MKRLLALVSLGFLAACPRVAPDDSAGDFVAATLAIHADGSLELGDLTCKAGADKRPVWIELRHLALAGERMPLDPTSPDFAGFSREWLKIDIEPQLAFASLDVALDRAYGLSDGIWRYAVHGLSPKTLGRVLFERPRRVGVSIWDRSWTALQIDMQDEQLHVMFGDLTPDGRLFEPIVDATSASDLKSELNRTRSGWRETWSADGLRVACGPEVQIEVFLLALAELSEEQPVWQLETAAPLPNADEREEELEPIAVPTDLDPTKR